MALTDYLVPEYAQIKALALSGLAAEKRAYLGLGDLSVPVATAPVDPDEVVHKNYRITGLTSGIPTITDNFGNVITGSKQDIAFWAQAMQKTGATALTQGNPSGVSAIASDFKNRIDRSVQEMATALVINPARLMPTPPANAGMAPYQNIDEGLAEIAQQGKQYGATPAQIAQRQAEYRQHMALPPEAQQQALASVPKSIARDVLDKDAARSRKSHASVKGEYDRLMSADIAKNEGFWDSVQYDLSNRWFSAAQSMAESAALMGALTLGPAGVALAANTTHMRLEGDYVAEVKATTGVDLHPDDIGAKEQAILGLAAGVSTLAEKIGVDALLLKKPLLTPLLSSLSQSSRPAAQTALKFLQPTLATSANRAVRALGIAGAAGAGLAVEGLSGVVSDAVERMGVKQDFVLPTPLQAKEAFMMEAMGGGVIAGPAGAVTLATDSNARALGKLDERITAVRGASPEDSKSLKYRADLDKLSGMLMLTSDPVKVDKINSKIASVTALRDAQLTQNAANTQQQLDYLLGRKAAFDPSIAPIAAPTTSSVSTGTVSEALDRIETASDTQTRKAGIQQVTAQFNQTDANDPVVQSKIDSIRTIADTQQRRTSESLGSLFSQETIDKLSAGIPPDTVQLDSTEVRLLQTSLQELFAREEAADVYKTVDLSSTGTAAVSSNVLDIDTTGKLSIRTHLDNLIAAATSMDIAGVSRAVAQISSLSRHFTEKLAQFSAAAELATTSNKVVVLTRTGRTSGGFNWTPIEHPTLASAEASAEKIRKSGKKQYAYVISPTMSDSLIQAIQREQAFTQASVQTAEMMQAIVTQVTDDRATVSSMDKLKRSFVPDITDSDRTVLDTPAQEATQPTPEQSVATVDTLPTVTEPDAVDAVVEPAPEVSQEANKPVDTTPPVIETKPVEKVVEKAEKPVEQLSREVDEQPTEKPEEATETIPEGFDGKPVEKSEEITETPVQQAKEPKRDQTRLRIAATPVFTQNELRAKMVSLGVGKFDLAESKLSWEELHLLLLSIPKGTFNDILKQDSVNSLMTELSKNC